MRKPLLYRAIVVCALVVLGASGVWASTPEPAVVFTCDYAQPVAPTQTFGNYFYGRIGVAWNGREYGIAYNANSALYFRRIFADGTPAAGAVMLASGLGMGTAYSVGMVWNGTGYAIAYAGGTSPYQATLVIVDANGAILRGPTLGSASSDTVRYITLAGNGNGYAVVWNDYRSGSADIYATLFNADGTVAGSGAYHDIQVNTTTTADQAFPTVAWSPFGFYWVAWQDYRTGTKNEIYVNRLNTGGTVGAEFNFASGSGSSTYPHIANANGAFGVVWSDSRDGNTEIYFARATSYGAKIGSDLRVTTDTSSSSSPHIVSTGGEYEVFWNDYRGGCSDIWHQRISMAGALQGSPTQLMAGIGTTYPVAAFATRGCLVAATSINGGGPLSLQPLGCSYAAFPPCPENAVAYNISGSQATLSWLPVVDPNFDIAYYQVYRNNALLGITSANVYTDSGLVAGTTYNYSIRSVNATQQVSTACPANSSVYVKANASLTLTVAKGATGRDADLAWTDAGMNRYNVYRGTDPQVMGLIGNTAALSQVDPNVLLDGVLYFYTVDDPGQ